MTYTQDSQYPNKHLLVDSHWLEEHRKTDGLVLLDARSKGYDEEHIPGAYWMDAQKLKDRSQQPAFVSADALKSLLVSYGVTNDSTIVVYDDGSGVLATRVFYVLEYYGLRDQVKVLGGGFAAWTANEFAVSSELPPVQFGSLLLLSANPLLVTTKASIQAGKNIRLLLDTRSALEHSGTDKRSNRKGGHIPGSIHKEWREALTPADEGGIVYFKDSRSLEREFEASGIDPAKTIVPYCQSNQRGAHSYFILRLLGYPDIRPYEGSWEEWGNDEDTEVSSF